MKDHYDYIIAGQGIAGTMLSWFLIKAGKEVLVIDQKNNNSSSRVAPGMFNPITGRMLLKTWKVDEIFPFAKETYDALEKELGAKFRFEKNVLRIFRKEEDINRWEERKSEEGYSKYAVMPSNTIAYERVIEEITGSAEFNSAGFIDVSLLLDKYREFLKDREQLLETSLSEEEVSLDNKYVNWNNIRARRLIFCRGEMDIANPYFDWLPFAPVKGEVLTVKMEGFPDDKIVNGGVFILPIGNDMFKVGATYKWDNLHSGPTEEGKQELLSKLDKLITCKYEVVDHQAGVRPAVKARRPLIGIHPDHSQLGIFNGLGTKGVTLAPYFANQFVEHLEGGELLDGEVDIRRWNRE